MFNYYVDDNIKRHIHVSITHLGNSFLLWIGQVQLQNIICKVKLQGKDRISEFLKKNPAFPAVVSDNIQTGMDILESRLQLWNNLTHNEKENLYLTAIEKLHLQEYIISNQFPYW